MTVEYVEANEREIRIVLRGAVGRNILNRRYRFSPIMLTIHRRIKEYVVRVGILMNGRYGRR